MAWFRKNTYSDADILADLRQGGHAHTRALEHLYYQFRPMILKMVQKRGGNEEDADEVLTEGIIRLDQSVQNNKFRGESKLSSYFHVICRNYWLTSRTRSTRLVYLGIPDDSQRDEMGDPLEHLEEEDFQRHIQKILDLMEPECLELLIRTDGNGDSMKIVAKKLGKSVQVARNKKSKCRKKLRDMILDSPTYMRMIKDFLNLEPSTAKK